MNLIDRREAIRRVALLMGAAIVGSEVMLRAESIAGTKPAPGFSSGDIALLDEIGETIIPATDIPGAKAAKVGPFMAMMVTDCYNEDEQKVFQTGLGDIDRRAKDQFGKTFVECSSADRTRLASELDKNKSKYFRMMKELTVLGFFTSEIGSVQALDYVAVPGSYDGNRLYTPKYVLPKSGQNT